jgi:murein DD-endopeptidase MepM/ murein hydrolase activator NlpD
MIGAIVALAVCITAPTVVPVPPETAVVTDWFRRPGCSWCQGNRGVEFALPEGTSVVVAATPGKVAFVGGVGGVPYVVVRIADEALAPAPPEGVYAVYGGVDGPSVRKGDRVGAGQMLGRSRAWLYVGFRLGPRRDDRHLDPAPLLGMSRSRSRLVVRGGSGTSLRGRPHPWGHPEARTSTSTKQCSVLPPVVASAR